MGVPARQKLVSQLGSILPASMSLLRNEIDLKAVAREYRLDDYEYSTLLGILQDRYRERQNSTKVQRSKIVRDSQQFDYDNMSIVERICNPEWRMTKEK